MSYLLKTFNKQLKQDTQNQKTLKQEHKAQEEIDRLNNMDKLIKEYNFHSICISTEYWLAIFSASSRRGGTALKFALLGNTLAYYNEKNEPTSTIVQVAWEEISQLPLEEVETENLRTLLLHNKELFNVVAKRLLHK